MKSRRCWTSAGLVRGSAMRSYRTGRPPPISINGGATYLSFSSQTANADWDGTPANASAQGQDAFSGPGNQLDLDTTEKMTVDVAGWDIAPVPEPGSLALLGMGLIAVAGRRKR